MKKEYLQYFPDRKWAYIIPTIIFAIFIIIFVGIMFCFKSPKRQKQITSIKKTN